MELTRLLVDYGLQSEQCHNIMFIDGIFTNVACVRMVCSRLLGVLVVIGAAVVKLPQIVSILRFGANGISPTSVLLEVVSYAIVVAHALQTEFPFAAYGETVFLLVQSTISTDPVFNSI